MTLDEYLCAPELNGGVTADAFARLCGITPATLSRIRHGANTTRDQMRKIIAASGGSITPEGLLHAAPDTARACPPSSGKATDLTASQHGCGLGEAA